jgi:hypothetical protein
MKKRTPGTRPKGKAAQAYTLLVKAESAERIFEAARHQWRLLKSEHKQARKAFKEARKAVKLARREAKSAAKELKRKGIKLSHALRPARGARQPAVSLLKSGKATAAKRNGGAPVLTSIQTENVPRSAVELQA